MANHYFEYRIGRNAVYSKEQWDNAGGENISDTLRLLKQVEPNDWCYAVYACILREQASGVGVVVKCSKHPAQPMSHLSIEKMKDELTLLGRASIFPVFDRDDFGAWDYLVINSDDLDQNIIDHAIQDLNEAKE